MWYHSFYFSIFTLYVGSLLTSSSVQVNSDPFLIGKSPEEVKVIFREKARNASEADPRRWDRVEKTLLSASGVYNYSHPLQKKRPEIQKSVMIVVLEFGKRDESYHYKVYMKNFICYVRHYRYKLIVYVALHIIADAAAEVRELEGMGVMVIDYPDELFWELHATKESGIIRGRGHADYDRQYPAFKAYGAIVMLVPVLEVLLHGYNVLFMDVDIAFLHDPVPYMTQGTANIALSLETRHCLEFYSTSYPQNFDWFAIEPNTGLMYLRRGMDTARAFKIFLERIVERNLINDQRVFDRRVMGVEWIGDCNGEVGGWKEYNQRMKIDKQRQQEAEAAAIAAASNTNNSSNGNNSSDNNRNSGVRRQLAVINQIADDRSSYHNNLRVVHHNNHPHNNRQNNNKNAVSSNHNRSNYRQLQALATFSKLQQKLLDLDQLPSPPTGKKPTFCFLNELHFQNGIIAIGCPNGKNRNIRDEYILELAKYGLPVTPALVEGDKRRSPITVHANYADKKTHELQVRGLWLLKPDYDRPNYTTPKQFCLGRKFSAENTYYGQHNWTAELNHIHERRAELINRLTNNTVVKTLSDGSVFMLDEHRVRHLVPDAETFVARFGDNWGSIRVLPSAMMSNLTLGEPLQSVK